MGEDVSIRLLREEDLGFAQAVRQIAGWNQTNADWLRLIRYEPEGCFILECNGEPAGTATTTTYGSELGWIGMVLVHPDFRRRGFATLLLKHCIDYLTQKVKTIRLDATPAGMEVYRKLGFVEEYRLDRWEKGSGAPRRLRSFQSLPLDEKAEDLDAKAFGVNRLAYLRMLKETATATIQIEDGSFGTIRQGSNALYLGPVIAQSDVSGRHLVNQLLSHCGEHTCYWDILEPCREAAALADELDFTKQRNLIRMRLGEAIESERPKWQWAIGAPETG